MLKTSYLFKQFQLVILACLIVSISSAQNLKDAKLFFKQKNYFQASEIYKISWNKIEKDNELLLQAGICFYEANALDYSIRCFEKLQSNTDHYLKISSWYLANAFQQKYFFDKAIIQYKNYLKVSGMDDDRASFVRNELLRCANALKYNRQSPLAIVESIGSNINTIQDEYAALPEDQPDNYLINAIKSNNEGGKRNHAGYLDPDKGFYRSDIYKIQRTNGNWGIPERVPVHFNSSMNDDILEFTNNGKILLVYKNWNGDHGQIIMDSIKNNNILFSYPEFKSPMIPEIGDHALSVFQDTLMIFSSCRMGGYGAYDLYISFKRNNNWTEAINLGPDINTPFNEDYPELANDGRTLYFSSDHLLSMGGYDIFKTQYWPEANRWSTPLNLGIPVNSAGNETHFRLTPDGLAGIFSSDRKFDNLGGKDIYLAYFKNKLEEQFDLPNGSPLANLLEENSNRENIDPDGTMLPDKKDLKTNGKENYTIDIIYYQNEDFLNDLKNKKILDQCISILQIHPQMKLEIIGHAYEDSQDPINLYFSLKKAEAIEQKFIENKIAASRLHSYGVGNSFPVAKDMINGIKSKVSEKLNRRIDLCFVQPDSDLTQIHYALAPIPESIKSEKEASFQTSRRGLSYSLFLGKSKSVLNHPLINPAFSPYFIDKVNGEYHYYSGIYKTFLVAEEALNQAKRSGNEIPEIKVFHSGKALNRKEIIDFVIQDPDLLNFMNYLKKKDR